MRVSGTNRAGLSDAVNGTVENISNQVNDMVSSALSALGANPKGVLGASLSDLTSQVTSSVTSAFGSINPVIGQLTSNLGALAQGPKEVMSQIETLSSSSSEALASPASFITKATSEVLQGTNSVTGNITENWLSDMGEDIISQISSGTGINVTDTNSLKQAINQATESLANGFHNATQGILGTGITSSISSAEDFFNNFVSGIKDTINNGPYTSVPVDIIDNIDDIVSGVTNILPDDIKNMISSSSQDIINNTISSTQHNISTSISNTVNKVTGLGIDPELITELMMKIYGYGGADLSGIVDPDGSSLTNSLGNNSGNIIQQIYQLAQSICNNITPVDYIDYDPLKNLYDLLLGLSGMLGINDLIEQLKRCQAADTLFFDKRSILTLVGILDTVITAGNPFTTNTIVQTVGANNIPDPKRTYTILGANLPDEPGYISQYTAVGTSLGVTPRDVLTSSTSSATETVIDGMNAVAMSATNTTVVSGVVDGPENQSLINVAMSIYNNAAGGDVYLSSNGTYDYQTPTTATSNNNWSWGVERVPDWQSGSNIDFPWA